MLHTRFYRPFLLSLLLITNTILPFAQNFTEEDRARMIRTETRLEAVEKRMEEGFTQVDKRFEQVDKRFEQVDKRFEQVDKRFDDHLSYIGYMIGLFGTICAVIIGFTFWDRRSMIRPFETKMNEIDTELKGEIPTPQRIRGLHYLKQVVDESMRCYPPAWIMGRKTIEKDVINGCEIPADTNVIMPIYVVHHDKTVWENPDDFVPERFAFENLKDKHKYSYFPFGGGPRLCIGNNFAIQEMQVCLAMILQKFRIEVDENFVPELEPLVTLRPKNEILAKVYKRK